MTRIRVAAASASLAFASCGGAAAFHCADDTQCAGADGSGICEPSGYCSFLDDACPTGRRYGARAPTGIAEECVLPPAAEGSDTGVDPTTGGDASSIGMTSDPATSVASTASSTTTPVDPPTSGGSTENGSSGPPPGDGSSTSAGQDTGTSTGEVAPACEVAFHDEFDTATLDPEWDSWASPGSSFAAEGGHLVFSILPAPDDWLSAGIYTQPHSLLGGHVRAQILPFEAPADIVGVWLSLVDPADCEVQVAVESSIVLGHSNGEWFFEDAIDTSQPMWIQLRVDPDGLVHFEYSTDGRVFTEVYADAPPCDFSSALSAIFAGDDATSATPVIREIEWYERCEAP